MRLFRRHGWLAIPTGWAGWFVILLFAGFAIYSFLEIDERSHSVSDTLMNFAFRVLLMAIAYAVVGRLLSSSTEE